MHKSMVVIISVLLGILITLLTGFLSTSHLLGATHYGFPSTWMVYMVVSPVYNPVALNYTNFVIDVAVWSVVAWVVLSLLLDQFASRKIQGRTSQNARHKARRAKR